MLHDVDELRVLAACHGYSVPTAFGLWGGLPAGCNVHRLLRETNVREVLARGELVTSPEQLSYVEEPLSAKPPIFVFGQNDVYEWGPQGGGGWGDPLLRDPADVAADVRLGAVTRATALLAYGVVVGEDGSLDRDLTDARRTEVINLRKTWPAEGQLDDRLSHGGAVEVCRRRPVVDHRGRRRASLDLPVRQCVRAGEREPEALPRSGLGLGRGHRHTGAASRADRGPSLRLPRLRDSALLRGGTDR